MKNKKKFLALKQLDLPVDQYAITASGPLGIRNLRDINDIDIIVTQGLWDTLAARYGVTDTGSIKKITLLDGVIEAFQEGSFYTAPMDANAPTIDERISKAEIIDGLPFDSLDRILYYKRKLGREKDLRDIFLIEHFLNMRFVHLRKEQQDLVNKWLKQDYVAKYWHGSGLQNTLNTIERFVNGQEKLFTLWMAYDKEIPFGYLMTSNVDLKTDHFFAKYCERDAKAITLDLLIGNTTYLGKGLSHIMINKFLLESFSSITDVFIDPGIENHKAIHVYEKAGFEKREEFVPEWDPTGKNLLMQLKMDTSQRGGTS
ncbi:GNAT family N-acetyltransferase [Simkania negevensis]|uniref:N-acetyltransferase domain-containing protein n=1 Tax=Simkania negevensis (strain ATCC VR-1471 / DSM 27360 / Z) TaxID=331113 RepID=F8L9A7_SIMNZ|nr:GNAT family N-acetyltransferase [Simkania negevensis]CCB89426.1 putative uncharacterized protein [Simkania negevensis Z]